MLKKKNTYYYLIGSIGEVTILETKLTKQIYIGKCEILTYTWIFLSCMHVAYAILFSCIIQNKANTEREKKDRRRGRDREQEKYCKLYQNVKDIIKKSEEFGVRWRRSRKKKNNEMEEKMKRKTRRKKMSKQCKKYKGRKEERRVTKKMNRKKMKKM